MYIYHCIYIYVYTYSRNIFETINQSLKGVQGVAFEHQDSKNSGSDQRLAEAMQDTQQLLLDAWGGAMHPRTY